MRSIKGLSLLALFSLLWLTSFGALDDMCIEELRDALILDLSYEGPEDAQQGMLSTFLLGFLGGMLALLTPCVFPMIPLTVTFFTKSNTTKMKGLVNASLYGFFIFLIYVLLSLPFHLIDGLDPGILHGISTNPYLNLLFFAVFVIFAISFFGYFEITMPSSLTNKVSSAEGTGGILGIAAMALTLALVSFSCTGPILGSLLVSVLEGGAWKLTAGMAGFGVALGLPFAIFAFFPGLMNALPKSGGWLNTVKVVLGFLELALAMKFLSNADLVWQLNVIYREIFFAVWIILGVLTIMYLMGWIRFPHDSKTIKRTWGRLTTAALVLSFVIYIIPGMWGANLTLLSGFPPPLNYSLLSQEGGSSSSECAEIDDETRETYGVKKCVHNLDCHKDFFAGQEYAIAADKPIFIDFTGHACINCRNMEEQVWPEENILDLMCQYTVIALYADEQKKLKECQRGEYDLKGTVKNVKTVGQLWKYFQAVNFGVLTQPYYVLLTPEADRMLTKPVPYTPDAAEYKAWLEKGLENYEKHKNGIAFSIDE